MWIYLLLRLCFLNMRVFDNISDCSYIENLNSPHKSKIDQIYYPMLRKFNVLLNFELYPPWEKYFFGGILLDFH